jgi:hypothetical protein
MTQQEAVMAVRKIFGEKPQIEWGEMWRPEQKDTLYIKCVVNLGEGKKIVKAVLAFDVNNFMVARDARQQLVNTMQQIRDDIADSLSSDWRMNDLYLWT